MATIRPRRRVDHRLSREMAAWADQLTSIAGLASLLARHLRDVESVGFDHDDPTHTDPTANKARSIVEFLRDQRKGLAEVERMVMRQASAMRQIFTAPAAEDLRGTLLGWFDDTGRFVAHSPSSELASLLKAQRRREARAPRTGETTHERLEPQAKAPKVRGLDPHEERWRTERGGAA